MKTTIDIAPNLLARAKKLAAAEKVTLRELTEEGLELALEKRRQTPSPSLHLVCFGDPSKKNAVSLDWEKIRDLVYP